MIRRFPSLVSGLATAALAACSAVFPAAAAAQDLPSYARPPAYSDDETIHGRIQSINGVFNLSVRDDRGFVDNVELHQGTIINPTGLRLADGMSVTIRGYNSGSAFAADEIDTPYRYAGPEPAPAYYGPGWWYPGFAYGYGPAFSLGFLFGGTTIVREPWRPYYGRPYYGRAYGYPGVAYGRPAPVYRYPAGGAPRAVAPRPAPVAARAPVARGGGSYGGGGARHR